MHVEPAFAVVGSALRLAYALALIAAAVRDARERRVPNAYALVLACLGLGVAAVGNGVRGGIGWPSAIFSVLAASAVCGLLVAGEALWRRWRGEPGLGMGDIKVLFSAMLVNPVLALVSFAAGLLALALCALFTRQRSLPLVPFFCASFLCLGIAAL